VNLYWKVPVNLIGKKNSRSKGRQGDQRDLQRGSLRSGNPFISVDEDGKRGGGVARKKEKIQSVAPAFAPLEEKVKKEGSWRGNGETGARPSRKKRKLSPL